MSRSIIAKIVLDRISYALQHTVSVPPSSVPPPPRRQSRKKAASRKPRTLFKFIDFASVGQKLRGRRDTLEPGMNHNFLHSAQ
jgi:hypothetical protein